MIILVMTSHLRNTLTDVFFPMTFPHGIQFIHNPNRGTREESLLAGLSRSLPGLGPSLPGLGPALLFALIKPLRTTSSGQPYTTAESTFSENALLFQIMNLLACETHFGCSMAVLSFGKL